MYDYEIAYNNLQPSPQQTSSADSRSVVVPFIRSPLPANGTLARSNLPANATLARVHNVDVRPEDPIWEQPLPAPPPKREVYGTGTLGNGTLGSMRRGRTLPRQAERAGSFSGMDTSTLLIRPDNVGI